MRCFGKLIRCLGHKNSLAALQRPFRTSGPPTHSSKRAGHISRRWVAKSQPSVPSIKQWKPWLDKLPQQGATTTTTTTRSKQTKGDENVSVPQRGTLIQSKQGADKGTESQLSMSQTSKRRRPVAAVIPPPPSPTAMSLIRELHKLAQEVSFYERPPIRLQQRNQSNIVRRIKLLGPLFEEVKECQPAIPPSAVLAFREIHLVIQRAKLLLDECREGSRLWLLVEGRRVSDQFHELTQELAAELSAVPMDLLEISVEVKEQVELLRLQCKRSTPYYDPAEERMRAEVQAMLGELERKESPDVKWLRAFFEGLQITASSECLREVLLLEEELESLATSSNGDSASMSALIKVKNLISFVRYCKCVLFGVTVTIEEAATTSEEDRTTNQSSATSTSGSPSEMVIPDEFRCPISLELMQDPVIIATGQTYDRATIQRWIESGHSTCPKSGQKLVHVNVIPNHALRSLIRQWCEDHKVAYRSSSSSSNHGSNRKSMVSVDNLSTRAAHEATKLTAAFLVEKLASGAPEVQKQVAYELRLLAKCGMDNRICIAEVGAVPFLVPLLGSVDAKTQENAITALLNLSICDTNKKLIVDAGAVDPILEVLKSGSSTESRENSAATLFSLSVVDEYKVLIGSKPSTFSSLVKLLQEGSTRGKRDAATALFNLAVYHGNKAKIVDAGAISTLVELLHEDSEVSEDALAVLALLASSTEGLVGLMGHARAVPMLVNMLRDGSPKGKENATAVLLALCRSGKEYAISQVTKLPTTMPSLCNLLATGTPRAKRKSSSLLRILHRAERGALPSRLAATTTTTTTIL